MIEIVVKPGDIVVSNFGVYQHWSLVTDRFCSAGKPMLISATKRNGTVQEEPWDDVVQGKETYVADIQHSHPVKTILENARSQIGEWAYSVTNNNCEHFVKWASGFEVSSTQVKAGVGGAVAGAALVGIFAEKPTPIKFFGGILVLAGLAVATTKAIEKQGTRKSNT
jgi:F0F1-type ATP synthase membrane subunit c/vacuolar-type H+-ATPase subunit K